MGIPRSGVAAFLVVWIRMSMITVVALQPFEFEGRSHVQDEVFEDTPINALAFNYQRWTRFAEPDESVAETASVVETKAMEPVAAPKAKRARKTRQPRGKYLRRDIAPEQTQ